MGPLPRLGQLGARMKHPWVPGLHQRSWGQRGPLWARPGGGWAEAPGTHARQERATQGVTHGPHRKASLQPLPQQHCPPLPPKDVQRGEGSGADMYCQNTELHSPEHWDRTPLTPPSHPPPKAQELGGIQAAPSSHPGSLQAPKAPEGNSPRVAPPVPLACPVLVETVPTEGPITTGIRDRVPAIPAWLRSSPQPGSIRPPCWGAPGCCPAQISCRKSTGKSPTLRPV